MIRAEHGRATRTARPLKRGGDDRMNRISLSCVVAWLALGALAEGGPVGGAVEYPARSWIVAAFATNTLPASVVQAPGGGNGLVRTLRRLVGADAGRAFQDNRSRIGAVLAVIVVIALGLVVAVVILLRRREARAVAALERDHPRGRKLRDHDRARMRGEQP